MPYKKLSDLPAQVQDNLPHHAEEIFLAAFNSAWEQYDRDEETAFKVAWSAVKKDYEKDEKSGEWKKK